MLGHLPPQGSLARSLVGERARRWSWYLFLLSWPWHLVGGAVAIGVTGLAGGNFTDGVGVPGYVYKSLYFWMVAPLVASFVAGAMGWVKGHRSSAIIPALVSAATIVTITVFGYEEFWG